MSPPSPRSPRAAGASAAPSASALRGGWGHTLTLFAAGLIVLSLDGVMPAQIARIFEFAVGIMLVLLGSDLLRRLIAARVHFHLHRHGDGTTHFHAHSHTGEADHGASHHAHVHVRGLPARALAVGLMHGLAGLGGADPAHHRAKSTRSSGHWPISRSSASAR